MRLNELRDYIGTELGVGRFRDYCPNGLQVEGRAEVRRIATGVTASQAVLEAATAWGADAILVHHGYFWRSEDAAITGIKKRRVAHLLKHDISLLAYHLPLDAHPEFGNNAQLGLKLGFDEQGRFGEQDIAMHGALVHPQTLHQLAQHIQNARGAGFNAKLDALAPGALHPYQQFLVKCADTGLAVPEDMGLALCKQAAERNGAGTISGKGIIPQREVDQAITVTDVKNLVNDMLRRPKTDLPVPESGRTAEMTDKGASTGGKNEFGLEIKVKTNGIVQVTCGNGESIKVRHGWPRRVDYKSPIIPESYATDILPTAASGTTAGQLQKRLLPFAHDNTIHGRTLTKDFTVTKGGVPATHGNDACGDCPAHKPRQLKRGMTIVRPLGNAHNIGFYLVQPAPDGRIRPRGEIGKHRLETGLPQTGMKITQTCGQEADVGVIPVEHSRYVGKQDFHGTG